MANKMNLAILSLMGVALAQCFVTSLAQNNPKDFLAPQNAARKEVGVAPLRWDTKLEEYAKNYAQVRSNDCALIHSEGPYGENIYWGMGDGMMNAEDAVRWWVDEKQYYEYDSNTCSPGDDHECLHYTQIVWRNTTSVGCGRSLCPNGKAFITCNYDPYGNIISEKPY